MNLKIDDYDCALFIMPSAFLPNPKILKSKSGLGFVGLWDYRIEMIQQLYMKLKIDRIINVY
jgi:hypothetical protein